MFKRVLVTMDGSTFSEAVLPAAARLLRGTGAEVYLLTVADEPQATAAHPVGEPLTVGVPAPGAVVTLEAAPAAETKAQAIGRITDELRDFLIARAVPFVRVGIRYHTAVRFGESAEEILRFAKKENVDLIMMATHGHTGLARLVFGSVASRVVAGGVCPVMLVRPDGLKPA
jgi:nucleotide-binding universal stress UspA family protein